MKKLIVKVKPGGAMEIDAQGFQGADCTQAVHDLLRRIGAQKETEVHKAEYYNRPEQHIRAEEHDE